MPTWKTGRVGSEPTSLAPDGSEIHKLPSGQRGSLARCGLPAGRVTRAVRHRTVEEVWYVTAGRGQVWRADGDGEEIVDVDPGTGLTIPTGVAFQFRAADDADLEIILTTMPPWPGSDEAELVEGRWAATVDA
jgi:mannose-6-phosphate isomerase-like protein (cupin superfamily)